VAVASSQSSSHSVTAVDGDMQQACKHQQISSCMYKYMYMYVRTANEVVMLLSHQNSDFVFIVMA